MYDFWDMEHERQNFSHFGPFFALYTPSPPNNPKNQNFQKLKKHPRDIIILHKCTINDNHIIYGSWDINCNRPIFFVILGHFLPFYPPPLTAPKMKLSKKWKKQLEISSFYASVSKPMVIHYTVPEIWGVTDVIVIFHFRLTFFTFTPLTAQKIKI